MRTLDLPMGSIINGAKLGYKWKGHMIRIPCVQCLELRWIEVKAYKEGRCTRCRPCFTTITVRRIKANATGRFVDSNGYIHLHLKPDNPHYAMVRKRGWVTEHRLVMAQHLGRDLVGKEIVHHLNSVRDDNRIENLQLTTSNEHASKYMRSYKDGYEAGYMAGLREGGSHQASL